MRGRNRAWNLLLNAHIPGVKASHLRKRAHLKSHGTLDLYGQAQTPPGFRYAADVFSVTDEHAFVREFESLPFKPFEFHGYLGKRRIVSYGRRYDYGVRALRDVEAIPACLQPLKEIASRFSGIPATAFAQALVTEYPPGAGIGWHRDKPMFEDVVGVSFLAPCVLRLRRKAGTGWERRSVQIEPRSAYLLRGPVRDEWEHSIAPPNVLRYSVTFRTLRPDYVRPSQPV
jgi:alkylated DNA repair dioxygenase AlkB